ncbi:MAG: pyrroloquinoline quinone biosynthesis peptide chaperone PqqD [Nostoc sp. ZfuVER08]|jgi:coenzyme PQQ biosynthesis protein PqqD|uniref:Pyrroloquinoline quinone biosynthesis peptide chaperone PqqD n=1 Tax=Nostoc punctiforme FACHB-252 TaxID=1357509 RepID=A0ABR8H4V3_NOSPU|nr:pyrroloquinoline quinone biosynthesis peptide chaperone PqqD [Nostoc punctiforme]MBD2610266.1 pyrroloquinoline quinone biosynthesis peptide chaperone PqqD [Nostoc punctiforme FACHB-252]MDZ8016148.1 pyrroloquinoline quinone biosynthesis peptide chaperone PqqD [Nostoc sp. ZfuVER08]
MSTIDNHARLRLVRGVRLRWDDVRKQHWLLVPEGALQLNSTAAAILALCNGERTLSAIATELEKQYQGENLIEDVRHLLSRISKRGLLIIEM